MPPRKRGKAQRSLSDPPSQPPTKTEETDAADPPASRGDDDVKPSAADDSGIKDDPDNKSTPKKKKHTETEDTNETPKKTASASKAKKLAAMGASPFPTFTRPTEEESQVVHDLLTQVHGKRVPPVVLVDDLKGRAGCGEVPNVLDALVRTILSQNTTSGNSTAAKRAMDDEYGRANYDAVLRGGMARLQKTITCGGLANVKGKCIYNVCEALAEKNNGSLSLDYLHEMDDNEAMAELVDFPGVGMKTASCVMLFCLKRPVFAVDTHVFRITRSLGWIPPSANRDSAFQHLDVKIPKHLKYGLHSLLVSHGRGCRKCAANGVTSMDHVEDCPINHLVKRIAGKKGKSPSNGKGKKAVKSKAKAKAKEESDGSNASDEEAEEEERDIKPEDVSEHENVKKKGGVSGPDLPSSPVSTRSGLRRSKRGAADEDQAAKVESPATKKRRSTKAKASTVKGEGDDVKPPLTMHGIEV